MLSSPLVSQSALPVIVSDHSAILLDIGTSSPKRRIFRFDKMWTGHPSFDKVVSVWWNQSPSREDPVLSFSGKLRFLKKKMRSWDLSIFGSIKKRKSYMLNLLGSLEAKKESSPLSSSNQELLGQSKTELLSILSRGDNVETEVEGKVDLRRRPQYKLLPQVC